MYKLAILLGVIQGLTEFLPISSSGHLVLLKELFDFNTPGVLFDALVHFGTLGSILYIFRERVYALIKAPFTRDENLKILYLILIATVPIVLVGFFFKPLIEKAFTSISVVGFSLLFTGGLLFLTGKSESERSGYESMKLSDSVFIGTMQVISLFPGVSRSGTTISAGIFRGIDRRSAAEFSFLLAVPAILGATFLNLLDVFKNPQIYTPYLDSYLLGTLFSFLSGIVAIKSLLSVIQRRKLGMFAYYCWTLGILALIYSYWT